MPLDIRGPRYASRTEVLLYSTNELMPMIRINKAIIVFSLITVAGCVSVRVPDARARAQLLRPGMTTNEVATILMHAEGFNDPPREWSKRQRYYVDLITTWPARPKSVFAQLPTNLIGQITFADDMTVILGMYYWNEYYCFYNQDAKLVTVWANTICD